MAFQTVLFVGVVSLVSFAIFDAASAKGEGKMLAQMIHERHGFSEEIKRPCHVVTVNLSNAIIQDLVSMQTNLKIKK